MDYKNPNVQPEPILIDLGTPVGKITFHRSFEQNKKDVPWRVGGLLVLCPPEENGTAQSVYLGRDGLAKLRKVLSEIPEELFQDEEF